MNPHKKLYDHLTNAMKKLNDLLKRKDIYSFQYKDEFFDIFLN